MLCAFAFGGLGFQEALRATFVSPLTFAASLNQYSAGLGRFVIQKLTRNPAAYLVPAAGLGIALLRRRVAPARVRAAALATVIIVIRANGPAPGDRRFDDIGMIPTRHIAGRYPGWWWDYPTLSTLRTRWDSGDRTEIDNILRDQPKLWLLVHRVSAAQERLGPSWLAATVRISEFLLLTGCQLDPCRETSLLSSWAGEYLLLDRDGRATGEEVLLDGVPRPGRCRVAPGVHRVSSSAAEPRFPLPRDFVATGRLPHVGPVRDLFVGIYDL